MPSSTVQDANDFLMGGEKIPSASFLKIGTEHEGEILDIARTQQTDPDDGTPMFWKNGDPMYQVRVTVQTEERDSEIEDDDGRRRFYLSYKKLTAVREAVTTALKEADLPAKTGMEIGGWLGLAFTAQEKATSRTKSGTKLYEAWYEPPTDAQRNAAKSAEANETMLADDPDENDEPEPPKATKRGRGKAAAPVESDSDEGDEPPAPSRRKRGSAAKEEPAAEPARGRGRRATASNEDEF